MVCIEIYSTLLLAFCIVFSFSHCDMSPTITDAWRYQGFVLNLMEILW